MIELGREKQMARNPEQNQRMRDDRRRRILSAAVRLFAVRGLAATKISDIAEASAMSQGLLYHYFKSKEDIFVDIIRMAFEKMNSAARGLERLSLSPREKLEMTVKEVLRSLDESEDFVWFSALISASSISDSIPDEAKTIIRRERDFSYRVVERIARAGQKDGSVRKAPPRELSLVFWTAVKGLAMHKAALGNDFETPSTKILSTIFFE
jgi:AcrR family transcriptional regulator